jgi:IS30 family transposase
MTAEMITLVEDKIRIKWSPEQISGWLRVTINKQISHETLYKHIWADKQAGGDLFTFLRRQGKAYQSRSKSLAGRGHIKIASALKSGQILLMKNHVLATGK